MITYTKAKTLLAPGDVVYTTNGREVIQARISKILADHLLTDVDCLFYDEHGSTWWLTKRVAKEKINNGQTGIFTD